MPENNEKIKSIIIELLRHMGYEAEVFERQEEGRVVFNIRTREAFLLIGKQGANLEAFQHAVKLIFRKTAGDELFPFAIDVDDYKDQRTLYLKELARKAAHHVKQTKKPVSLEPMPAHERRVVHSYLSLYNDVGSESIGVEPNRKLIIKPLSKPKADDGFNLLENS
jgi:spoIIIJ-associated protein